MAPDWNSPYGYAGEQQDEQIHDGRYRYWHRLSPGALGRGQRLPLYTTPTFAEVIASKPITETIKTPRQECRNVTVTHRKPVQDEHKILGTVVGAALGGVVGHQFGGGSGKKVATAAGAVAGGYAGNQVQGNMQAGDTYTTTEQRCKTVQDTSVNTIGYDVTYRLAGQEGVIRMKQAPGATIPVKDG